MAEIADILRSYPADCWPTQIEPLGSAGGLSGAQFWRLVAPRGTLVLRRWPIEHPTPDGLRFIHDVLQHADLHCVAILPVPIVTTDSATFVRHAGHLWELTPWLAGAADYEKSPRVEKLRAAMTALANFHIAVADSPIAGDGHRAGCLVGVAAAPAVTSRLTRLRTLQSGGIDELASAINDQIWPDLAPLAGQFLAALPVALPPAIAQLARLANAPLPLQPCIRDIWHDHVLFDGDRVAGLIDFGAMQIDTPATDVARLMGSLVADDPTGWRDGLGAYTAIRPLTESERLAVSALDRSGTILAGCNWIRWIYVEARMFEDRAKVIERFRQIAVKIGLIVVQT